jgi:hypothetical protein
MSTTTIPTVEHPPDKTPTPTTASTLTPTTSPTELIVVPPLIVPPTLPPGNSQKQVAQLLDNNNGCKLPCWWGIVPGRTVWRDAKSFLSDLDSVFLEGEVISETLGGQTQEIFVKVPAPNNPFDIKYIFQDYTIRNGLVEQIEIYSYSFAPRYSMVEVIDFYNKPDEILLSTIQTGEVYEGKMSWPFSLYLFYPSKGFLMEYGPSHLSYNDEYINACFQESDASYIYLWSPRSAMTFREAVERFLDTKNMPYPLPLNEAANTDVDTFNQSFKDSGGATCVQTPRKIWPDQ